MLSPTLVLFTAAALVIFYLASVAFKPGLRSIPGPWLAKISNLYRVGMVRRGLYSYEIMELHRKYGPTVRIGPDTVSLTDRRLVDDIYGFRTNFSKSAWVKSSQTLYQGKVVPALMTTQDKEYHLALKKSVASTYSVSTLKGYEASVEDTVRFFLERLDQLFTQTGKQCPMDKWLQWYAYDVIGAVTMSRPMGLLEQGRDVDGMLLEIQTEADYRAIGAVMPIIDWLYRKNSFVAFFSAPTHKIMVRARKMLEERLNASDKPDAPRRDFISRFLEAKDKNPQLLNHRNMLGFVGSNLQAGSDTTAIALRTILYYVLRDEAIISKMREELDAPGVTHPIPFQQAFNDLPYVGAVIQEALRIHPPFALLLERSVPASGLTLPDGTVLPENTIVGMFGYTMHREKEVFGEDADTFNPDRWLRANGEDETEFKERLRLMKSLDMTFGHGQRRCVGVHVAELQIYKLIPAMVGLLDMELVNPEKTWRLKQTFFSLQFDIDVRIKWREGKTLDDLVAAAS